MTLETAIQFYMRAAGSKSVGMSLAHDLAETSTNVSWDSGTGATEADQSYHVKSVALAVSTTDTYDFLGGGLTDAFGDAVAMARVKILYVKNTSSTDATIAVGGTNGIVGSGVSLRKGEILLLACGVDSTGDATCYPVTGGSTDTITVQNESGVLAATYEMLVVGATA